MQVIECHCVSTYAVQVKYKIYFCSGGEKSLPNRKKFRLGRKKIEGNIPLYLKDYILFLHLINKLFSQLGICCERNTVSMSSIFKHFIQNLSTFQTLKTQHQNSSISRISSTDMNGCQITNGYKEGLQKSISERITRQA